MSSEKSDEEIVALLQGGEEDTFRFLIERYTAPLYNFTARLAGRENAADLTQETFIKIWKNIRHFDPNQARFKTWIFTIAKNSVIDFLRKKKILNFSDFGNEGNEEPFWEKIPDESDLPDKILERLENAELLNKFLKKLPAGYQAVLTLHYQEDLAFEEIGKILGKPTNTVKSHHQRALLRLRQMLE